MPTTLEFQVQIKARHLNADFQNIQGCYTMLVTSMENRNVFILISGDPVLWLVDGVFEIESFKRHPLG